MLKVLEHCKNDCQSHIDEGGGKITSPIISKFDFPENIKNLIKQDYKMFFSIVDFHIEDFKIIASKYEDLIEALNKFTFIKNPTNDKNKILIEFNQIILPWLKTTSLFVELYEEFSSVIIKPEDIIPITNIKKFIPRENQAEAFIRLESKGLETGIHCQATGCGKSFIIIRYCDYAMRTISNPKIILFTERVNILSDLFSFTKGKLEADKVKLAKWKDLGIGDLTKFKIINRVTNKKKDWDKLLIESEGPTLLVINRAFLTLGKKYKGFNTNSVHLILHDECHNTSSVQCHDLLVHLKLIGTPIVGFSATPLRTGKTDKPKLLEIYANPKNPQELNLLTNYNMIYAISKNLILPPEFYWYQIESYNKEKSEDLNSGVVTQEELGSVLELLNHLIPLLPNKKLVAWCGTIGLAKKWKEMIESSYKQRKHLVNFKFGIDTSDSALANDYGLFSKPPVNAQGQVIPAGELDKSNPSMYWGNSILFCASKHREGSDIGLLDGCIFLDKVKDRGPIPFIQSIGRVLRICSDTPGKTKGVVIDGFVKEGNAYEKQFVDKIIGYYMALENLTGLVDNETGKTKYEQYVEMSQIVQFDKEKEVIDMKLGSNVIKIHCNKLEWDKIIGKFDSVLQEKIKLGVEDNFIHKAQILREVFGFNESTNFIKAYKAISPEDKAKYNLPDIEGDDYIKIFGKKSWFDFLGLVHDYYPDKLSAKKELKKLKIKLNDPNKNWKKWVKLDSKLPPYPAYVWDGFTWNYFVESDELVV